MRRSKETRCHNVIVAYLFVFLVLVHVFDGVLEVCGTQLRREREDNKVVSCLLLDQRNGLICQLTLRHARSKTEDDISIKVKAFHIFSFSNAQNEAFLKKKNTFKYISLIILRYLHLSSILNAGTLNKVLSKCCIWAFTLE